MQVHFNKSRVHRPPVQFHARRVQRSRAASRATLSVVSMASVQDQDAKDGSPKSPLFVLGLTGELHWHATQHVLWHNL